MLAVGTGGIFLYPAFFKLNKTNQMEGIYKKLLIIQNSVENFVKNKQAFNYSYVDGNTVLNHIRPLMNDQNLILKQEVLSIDNERYDYVTSKGIPKTEVLCKLMMKFSWIDGDTGEKDESLFGANGMNDFDKGVGSALTYAERYFLLKYFHITTDADDADAIKRDVHQTSKPLEKKTYPKPADQNAPDTRKWLNENTKDYNNAINKLIAGKIKMEEIMKFYKVSKLIQEKLLAAIPKKLNADGHEDLNSNVKQPF